jgi:peroxiredoxin
MIDKRLVPFAVLGAVLFSTPFVFGQRPSYAPDFTLKDLSGKEYTLSRYRGKVVLLNFWVTWCPPCRLEMSELQKVHSQLESEKRAEPVLLTINIQEPRPVVQQFADELGLTFPILSGSTQGVAMRYRVDRFPITFMIDPEGTIIRTFYGPITYERILEFVK